MRRFVRVFSAFLCVGVASVAGAQGFHVPEVLGEFGSIPEQFAAFEVILEPEKDAPEWWAGAPSAWRDADGVFWLACRMRIGEGERGLRGYELRILRSEDGVKFEEVLKIPREAVPIPGFERPALLQDPVTGKFKLYACGPWKDGVWSIIKFADADSPEQFRPDSAYAVISPPEKRYERDIAPLGYKDPVIIHANGAYHCYVIGYIRQNERIFHFRSEDGERWEAVGNGYDGLMPLAGWHNFFTRPASVVPVGIGYLFVYEGSQTSWFDPVYNVVTGVGFTFDLHQIVDLTPESPLIVSSTPSERFATWRYSSWLWVEEELWVYAEVAKPNESHEIRLFRMTR